MSHLLRCPNGHQWEARAGEADLGGNATLPCPVCGAVDKTLLPPPTLPLAVPFSPAPGLDAPAPESFPTLAGYEVLDELGRGGMGIVYRAVQRDRGRVVALKVIRKERLAHPDMVSRFQREARAAARLSHPNIVVVYEADQVGDVHFLAMEYVPGVTLQHLVEEAGPLPVPQACEVVRQTALGLQHAADQRLVHRDIKPANLMVVKPTGAPLPARPVVKILDMGVARLYTLRDLPEESVTTLTRDGAVIGTPDYVAPEQLEDPHRADIRADLYSLGCTFYFLLTGHPPFSGGTLIQKLDRQRWETAPSVDQLRPEVPAPVAAVVRRLMAKHPDDRYREPAELAAALDQLARTGVLPRGHQPAPLRAAGCLEGHAGPVIAVAFTADGHALLSAGADRTVRLWDLAARRERLRFLHAPHEIGCLTVNPSTSQVLIGQGVRVRILDLAGREVMQLRGHTNAVRAVTVSRDGRYALTGGDDRMLRLWDLHTGREVQRLAGHRAGITSVALSADGRHALSGGRDGILRLWEAGNGREVRTFAVPRGAVLGVAFSAGGTAVVSGHFDTTLRLWDLQTGKELRRFAGHRQMISGVSVAPEGWVVSASHDQTVRVWDPEGGCELCCGQGHTGPVACVAVRPDGRRLASAGFDQTVRLWELPWASEGLGRG